MAKACFHFMRVILVIISLIFMLLGLAVVALAVFLKIAPPMVEVTKGDFGSTINIFIYIIIGLGAFMAIFGFIGCFGACRKSTVCLGIYITILLIIIIGEIGAGVYIVVQTKALMGSYSTWMDKVFVEQSNASLRDKIQEAFKCCGSNGSSDYSMKIPKSCCKESMLVGCSKLNAYKKGCKNAIKYNVAEKGFSILIGVILGIAGVEFIGIAFAIAICCHSRRQDAGYVSVVT